MVLRLLYRVLLISVWLIEIFSMLGMVCRKLVRLFCDRLCLVLIFRFIVWVWWVVLVNRVSMVVVLSVVWVLV